MNDTAGLLPIIVVVATLGLLPLAVVTLTGFLKISIVMFLARNAMGVQQTPPNLVIYGIALVLTLYVTTPLIGQMVDIVGQTSHPVRSLDDIKSLGGQLREPLKTHLGRFAAPAERAFFLDATASVWSPDAHRQLKDDDLVVLVPAFVGSELKRAFEIGFLIYIPFLIIDLVVSNVLMAMGMTMVSPALISVPLKIFLFVSVDGWSRLMHGLILSYGS
jgi:type III secretion protein R